jgi:peroxiredoxin Q/BCP
MGAIVFGVSPDSPKKHRNFIEKKELDITLLCDEDKSLCKDFGVWQLKKSYGREYMGVVRSTFLISPNGVVAFKWDKVRVKGHVEAVKEKLHSISGMD